MSALNNRPENRLGEQGNVLFLNLIAVVMVAALSYAVTRTTNSDGGGVDNEKDKIAAAQLIQYPAGVRTAIVRMVIGGSNAEDLRFDQPSDFAGLTDLGVLVFHPEGGGATYITSPPDMMASAVQGTWYFNAEFEVENLGLSQSGSDGGNEIIAFLPGIRKGLCASVNEDLGISGVPNTTNDMSSAYKTQMVDGYTLPAGESVLGTAAANGTDSLTGQSFGCFQNSGGEYVYYHVLADR
jgi:hypothetical protein